MNLLHSAATITAVGLAVGLTAAAGSAAASAATPSTGSLSANASASVAAPAAGADGTVVSAKSPNLHFGEKYHTGALVCPVSAPYVSNEWLQFGRHPGVEVNFSGGLTSVRATYGDVLGTPWLSPTGDQYLLATGFAQFDAWHTALKDGAFQVNIHCTANPKKAALVWQYHSGIFA
jgi:hypothetical protein